VTRHREIAISRRRARSATTWLAAFPLVASIAACGGSSAADLSSGGPSPAPAAPGVPAESDLRLSPDESGRLAVDLVLADGTLEPVWVCERAPGAAAEP
jgi:hypothetical protein